MKMANRLRPNSTSTVLRVVLSMAWLLVCLLTVAQAQAQPDSVAEDVSPQERAQELKLRGDKAMESIEYGEALRLYEAAYAIAKSPALLYNRGRALGALARFPEAVEALESFAETAPASLKARVPRLQELIDEFRARVGRLSVKCDVPGATIIVRKQVVGKTPLGKPVALNAGPATVDVLLDGYFTVSKRVDIKGKELSKLTVSLVRKSDSGVLSLTTQPSNATVEIDGTRRGSTPLEVGLKGGTHQLVVHLDGYDTAEPSVVITRGKKKQLNLPLEQTAITKKWWFWTAITGAVLIAGGVSYYAATKEKEASKGDIAPGRISAPLLSF